MTDSSYSDYSDYDEPKVDPTVIPPLTLSSPFAKTLSTSASGFSSPNVDLVIPGVEDPLHFHRSVLSEASGMFMKLFKKEDCSVCSYDEETHRAEWLVESAQRDNTYRVLLVKWLRFCYGEDLVLIDEESETALTILSELQLQGQNELKKAIVKYQKECAEKHAEQKEREDAFYKKHSDIKDTDNLWVAGDFPFSERKILTDLLKNNAIPTDVMLFSLEGYPLAYAKMAAEFLRTNTILTCLTVAYNGFHAEGARLICEALQENTTLLEFGFSIGGPKTDDNKDPKSAQHQREAISEMVKANSKMYCVNLSNNTFFRDEGVSMLCESLKVNTALTDLRLSAIYAGSKSAQAIGELLKVNSTLKKLDLSENHISSEGLTAFCEGLKTNNSLTWLDLFRNYFVPDVRNLGEALKNNHSLTYLNLNRCRIGPGNASQIGEGLKSNSGLTELNLSENIIGPEGAKSIGEGLSTNRTLTHLDLHQCMIEASGGREFGEGVKANTSLTYLDLGENDIGPVGASLIGERLKANCSLTWLNLYHNNVGVQGAKKIAEGLANNSGLTHLCLKDIVIGTETAIGDEGSFVIGHALKTNSTLKTLDLTHAPIHHEGMKMLCDALTTNSALTELFLGFNEIGRVRTHYLSEMLKRNSSLKTLDLSGNHIGDSQAKVLSEGLRMNKSLTKVELRGNLTTSKGYGTLKDVLSVNTTLTKLEPSVRYGDDCCVM